MRFNTAKANALHQAPSNSRRDVLRPTASKVMHTTLHSSSGQSSVPLILRSLSFCPGKRAKKKSAHVKNTLPLMSGAQINFRYY